MRGTIGAQGLDRGVARPGPARGRRLDVPALVVAITAVVGVALARVVTLGFVPVSPDDAAYIGVGRELWSFQPPLAINGQVFTIRSWAYPLLTGAASRLVGGDPFTGPRLLGWALATAALVLAVAFAFQLARGVGAIATALAILLVPELWRTTTSTRVEVALICSLLALLMVMGSPSPRRMVIGGALAGLTLLIKETSAPLVILPLAYLGTLPNAQWRRLTARYLVGFVITVGWWFVTVLLLTGEIFPLEGLRRASEHPIHRGWTLNLPAQLLIVVALAGWLVTAIGRRHEPLARLLVLAGLAFVPAAYVAWQAGYGLRQFVPIALLSCIALGVGAADVTATLVLRVPRAAKTTVVAIAVVVGLLVLVPVALTQDHTHIEAVRGADLDVQLGHYFSRLSGEPAVLTSFKFNEQMWARLGGDATVRRLRFDHETHPRIGSALWIDARGRDYASMPRENLSRRLHDADYLVLTGPHTFGPIALATWLQQHGADAGLIPVAHFGAASGTSWAYVYRVDRPKVRAIPTIVTAAAVDRLTSTGGFHPRGPIATAATQAWLQRYATAHPPDGPEPYEPLVAPPR